MRKILFLILLCLTLPQSALSASPPCTDKVFNANEPYGKASLHKLLFHVYDAEFWTDDPNGWSMKTPHALYLKYDVSIDKQDLVKRTLEELQRNKAVTSQMLEQYQEKLPSLFRDVRSGQTITALYQPGNGITFCHNAFNTGVLDNKLAEPFMGIWLGKSSSEPDLRDALLGKK